MHTDALRGTTNASRDRVRWTSDQLTDFAQRVTVTFERLAHGVVERDGIVCVFEDASGAAAYLDRFLRILPQALKNPDLTIAELAQIA